MVTTTIQLYTLRALDRSLPELLDLVGETSFDGVEFAHRVGDEPTAEVAEALDRNDLIAPSAHVGFEALESDYEATIETYETLGVETLIVPWLGEERFESAAAVADTAERLNELADDLAADGFAFGYHNHDHELVPIEDGDAEDGAAGRTALDELVVRTDDRVGFEIDLGWVNAGGVDPAAFVDRHADRVTHVHFSDTDVETREAAELGEGDLDLDACLDAVRRADVEWYIYENDEPTDPIASLEYGAETLERFQSDN